MPSTPPSQLGSKAHFAEGLASPPNAARISPESCTQLSLFKDLMREYRKIDDAVTMRLNRTNAQFRDREREHGAGSAAGSGSMDDACAFFWTELVANWRGRLQVVEYCVDVVDKTRDAKRSTLDGRDAALEEDPRARRRLQAEVYADQVKRNQIHDELTVERIVRQRSFDAFRSRCKFWTPPASDTEGQRWWDRVSRGQ